ncbi:AAA family ATPase, partial [Dapis sp. BLCC M126]|uniref:AAA family ATPase n=1 Tax=Dapis sp. BLCC M126 TaxID=3400189 RepID=UPI003CFA14CA
MKIANHQTHELIHESERTLVYRGQNLESGQQVIIKLMAQEYPSFNELVQFRNQYAIAKNLEIEGIVKPYSLLRYKNGYALIMEDIGAISLAEYQRQFSVSIEQFWEISLSIAEILHHLHQNYIIHKDIKPANILIHQETQEVKLIDFSISSLLPKERTSLQTPNVLEGTLVYLSPEQTGRMNRGIDYRSDFYSLGVTLYELLTGKLPFESEDPLTLVHAHIAKTPPTIPDSLVPKPLADIIFKLMAKNAEERYQSALGLKYDLEKCRVEYEETGKIEPFVLGEQDRSARFLIPEKLYGREKEVQILLDAFERVAAGKTEMMLVAGFSGIGKTVVVNEVHKPITRQKGYFIKGKFDQFNRNIPFSAFVQAFRDLMGQLLGESDAELREWKEKILEALGENGQVLVDVIPELKQIIGEQSPVPELSGSASQNRFNLLFEKFIAVFTTQEHPLTLFLDDLQWADSASLNLLKILIGDNQTGYLLLLGAYRDNEVFPAHPLMLTLGKLEQQNTTISTITLTPLSVPHINQLVAETLSCSQDLATPLTDLVYQKTKGNPFFTTQFLKGLHEDDLIAFNRNLGYWECDLVKVRDATLTDDVVEFMAGRLHKLPKATQNTLKLAACIGNQFDLETLAVICENSLEEVAADLWNALREGLILPQSEAYKFFQSGETEEEKGKEILVSYRFLHDRVQQAAYSLIPDEQKNSTHYRIGQQLLHKTPPEMQEGRIFQLVGQLNYGTAFIRDQTEREQLTQLNLLACHKAKSATAYDAGYEYATVGLSLLGENPWQHHYDLVFALTELAAELAVLCGDWDEMERRVAEVMANSHSIVEQANVYRIQIQAHASRHQLAEAIAIGLAFLQQMGVTFPETPVEQDVEKAIASVQELMVNRQVEDLLHLPDMVDTEKKAMVQIAESIFSVTYINTPLLYPLVVCWSVCLSIQYGNSIPSAHAYAAYGLILCTYTQSNTVRGVTFSQLALELIDTPAATIIKPEVLLVVGLFILHRTLPIRDTLPLLQAGYTSALETGNYEFAGYNAHSFCSNSFWAGCRLDVLTTEHQAYCHSLDQLNQVITANYARIYWQTVLNLLGCSEHRTQLTGEALHDGDALAHLQSANDVYGLFLFHAHKLMLCYLFEDIEAAHIEVEAGRKYLLGGAGTVNFPAFHFYMALSALAPLQSDSENRSELFQRAAADLATLQDCADYAPMNHQHKCDLIKAEQCRVLDQKLQAIDYYDNAIAGAKENEYIQEEALANELFAKFYLDWGREKEAALYMQEAYYCYARWGAKAKVADLETRYPHLLTPILQQQQASLAPSSLATMTQGTLSKTTAGTGDVLDLATLMKTSRTLSENIELEGAIANLMKVVRENAGAETAALMLFQEEVLMLSALVYGEDTPQIDPIPVENSNAVPLIIVNKVKRTQKAIALDNASKETAFAGDAYIQQHQPQSILCLPLVDRGKLIGILYLENNQVAGAFTDDRIEILNLLCSQAAIALQNAQLYDKEQLAWHELQQALTDLQQAQLQLVQSEKMATLGNLVAGVAHEINNPVGFITGSVSILQEYLEDLLAGFSLYQEHSSLSDKIVEQIEELDLEFVIEELPKIIASMEQGCNILYNISKSMRTFSRTDTVSKTEFNLHDG